MTAAQCYTASPLRPTFIRPIYMHGAYIYLTRTLRRNRTHIYNVCIYIYARQTRYIYLHLYIRLYYMRGAIKIVYNVHYAPLGISEARAGRGCIFLNYY